METAGYKRITLVLTNKCMLSCAYCEGPKDQKSMSAEVLKKSLISISKLDARSRITIIFFGGEPLIKFNLIKNAVNIIKKVDDISRYDLCIFTNGVLLNKIDLDFLAKYHLRLQISIDGIRSVQMAHRKGAGIDTYKSIVSAFRN